ncbi:MAG: hypothetical protein P8182_11640, partial [Deltaproteobacteria bacterium]
PAGVRSMTSRDLVFIPTRTGASIKIPHLPFKHSIVGCYVYVDPQGPWTRKEPVEVTLLIECRTPVSVNRMMNYADGIILLTIKVPDACRTGTIRFIARAAGESKGTVDSSARLHMRDLFITHGSAPDM